MADVIRRAIIEVEYRSKRGAGGAPGSDADTRAQREAAKVQKEVEKATQEAAKATKEAALASDEAAKATKEVTKATDEWAAGMRNVNAAFRERKAGQDAWSAGLAKMNEQTKAVGEVGKAMQEAGRATAESSRVNQEFGLRSARSFREAGHGALQLARGLALLSSSGSDDLQKLIQKVALAQGAFDVFAGGSKVWSGLALTITRLGSAFLPVAVGIGAVSAVLAELSYRTEQQRKAEARLREENERATAARKEQIAVANEAAGKRSGEFRAAAEMRAIDRELAETGTPAEQRARLQALDAGLQKDERRQRETLEPMHRSYARLGPKQFQLGALEDVLASENEQLRLKRERVDVARELHNLDQAELQQRRQAALEKISRGGGTPEMREHAESKVVAEFNQIAVEADKIHFANMQKILEALKDQQAQVNQATDVIRQARRAAEGR